MSMLTTVLPSVISMNFHEASLMLETQDIRQILGCVVMFHKL